MEIDFVEVVRAESQLMAELAAEADMNALAPTPNWTVHELLAHTGAAQGWAASVVEDAAQDLAFDSRLRYGPGSGPVIEWFTDRYQNLVRVLTDAPANLDCATFIVALTPRAMWRRRAAHEVAVHRFDLEEAVGLPSPVDRAVADDGIDELLVGFLTRPSRGPQLSETLRLLVSAIDTDSSWIVAIGPDGTSAARGDGDSDVQLSGTASDLYLGLWNRSPRTRIREEGSGGFLTYWYDNIKI